MGRFLLFALHLPFAWAALGGAPEKIMPAQNHQVWTAAQGFPSGYVYAITQTSDGYLWIGSSWGLIRYDGLGFSLMRETDHRSPANFPVLGLAKDEAGQLWVVDDVTHLFRYTGGRLSGPMPDSGLHRHRLALVTTNQHGSLVFASELQGIVAYEQGTRRVVLDAGAMPNWPTAIAQTADGTYWIGTRDEGVLRFKPNGGVPRIEPVAGMPDAKINCMLPVNSSTLLVCTNKGLVSLHNGTVIPQTRPELNGHEMLALASGREGQVWIAAEGRLFRTDANQISDTGTIRSLDPVEAPSPVTALFEDRDGNLWIGAPDTIERIRGDGFDTYSSAAGLPSSNCGAIYVDDQGSVWFGPWDGGLFRLTKGSVEEIRAAGLNHDTVYSISGSGDEIWVARKYGGVTRLRSRGGVSEMRTYRQRDGLAQDSVYSIYQAPDGAVWAGTLSGGVSCLRDNTWRTFTTRDGLPSNTISVITGNAQGQVFIGTPNGLAELGSGGWVTHTTREGLPPGAIESLFADSEGTLWIGTAKGIAFLESGVLYVPLKAPDPLYGEILGIVESGGWLWISTGDHVLRVKPAALRKDVFDAGEYREFAVADGLPSVEGVKRSRSVVKDNQGRVWFSLRQGISVLSPAAFTHPVFPVTTRPDGVVIDGKLFSPASGIRVAPGPRRLTFRYAGVNVSNPEDVRYRYRLDNLETGWSAPTAMREVDYTSVPPGTFTFHVQARNADGVWGGQEATMTLHVEPAVWQNRRYQLLAFAALLILAWALYRQHLRQIAARADLRFSERLGERTRIARELHDTLLQSFQALLLHLQVVDELLPPGKAKEHLEETLERADHAIAEGRAAVSQLRSSATTKNDLAEALGAVGDELATPDTAAFHLVVEGPARDLHPIVRDELYRISREALRNAFHHARAHHVETEITYGKRLFRLRIRDDGTGIPAEFLEQGRPGHYGLPGIRERAQRIGGKLQIWSGVNAGTEIELSIAGSIAYSAPADRPIFRLFRRKAE